MATMNADRPRRTATVLRSQIDVLTWQEALDTIGQWASAKESRYVCICNAHSVVTASQDVAFARVIDGADMATPDGAPVAWLMSKVGHVAQQRINGPDLMLKYCEIAATRGESIFLYGSSADTLAQLTHILQKRLPSLKIAGALSPPFRNITPEEDADHVRQINDSGAGVVFVSLGCPKQERWMSDHRGRVCAVMIGVGAAFDFHAGTVKRAPEWMRENGIEWLHRLASEPRRLWKRYLTTNTLFILKAAQQLVRTYGAPPPR